MQSKTWLSLAAAVIALGLTAAKQLPPTETGGSVLAAGERESFGARGAVDGEVSRMAVQTAFAAGANASLRKLQDGRLSRKLQIR